MVYKTGDGRFGGLGLKTIGGGLLVWSAKLGVVSLVVSTSKSLVAGLTSLGLKTRSGRSADMWWYLEASIVAKQDREDTESIGSTRKTMGGFTLVFGLSATCKGNLEISKYLYI